MSRLLSTGEVARRLGFKADEAGRKRVVRLIRDGELEGRNFARDGKRPDWRVPKRSVDLYEQRIIRRSPRHSGEVDSTS